MVRIDSFLVDRVIFKITFTLFIERILHIELVFICIGVILGPQSLILPEFF
jgi:hypothetical protein